MKKIEKFMKNLIDSNSGILPDGSGYITTVGELLDNGGKKEFFRTIRKKSDGYSFSRNVYYNLEYNRSSKTWDADCYTDISEYKCGLKRSTKILVGFTF